MSRAFTPRRVTQLEARIRELCAELFDAQRGRDEFDYVQDFAARLPAEVIAALIGVPESDREFVREHIDLVFHIEPGRRDDQRHLARGGERPHPVPVTSS